MGSDKRRRAWAVAAVGLAITACETVTVAPASVAASERRPERAGHGPVGVADGVEQPPADVPALPLAPVSPEATDLPVALAAGFYETCAALTSGRVGCWGRPSVLDAPPAATFALVPGVEDATDVAAGRSFACSTRSRGGGRCWGRIPRTYGKRHAARPMRSLGSSPIVDLAAGLEHLCSVDQGGHVRCFGTWSYGTTIGHSGWTVRDVEGAVEVAAGETHACARLRNGRVRCWGENDSGQMGDGSDRRLAHARDVPEIEGARAIASHFLARLTCALLAGDEVRCWGAYGASRERVLFSATPAALPPAGAPLADIALGPFEVCAIREDGAVVCWTRSLASARGQRGAPLYGPARKVEGVTDVAELAMGVMHACARRRDGRVLCWGMNTFGQLGDGTTDDHARPVAAVHVPARPGDADG